MTFEGHNIRIIAPLDPTQGPRYTELICVDDHDDLHEETRDVDDLYKVTSSQDNYVNPTMEGALSWRYDSSCTSDSDEGLENWQNRMHELSGMRCARLTKSLHWIST